MNIIDGCQYKCICQILVNWIQQYLKKIAYHGQVGFIMYLQVYYYETLNLLYIYLHNLTVSDIVFCLKGHGFITKDK